ESDTNNNVIRRLLKLKPEPKPAVLAASDKGATFQGIFFPDGTQFQATHKGRTYTAEITNGVWVDSDGPTHSSPYAAAIKITGTNWNGWRCWYAKRPTDSHWQLIDKLREAKLTRVGQLVIRRV